MPDLTTCPHCGVPIQSTAFGQWRFECGTEILFDGGPTWRRDRCRLNVAKAALQSIVEGERLTYGDVTKTIDRIRETAKNALAGFSS